MTIPFSWSICGLSYNERNVHKNEISDLLNLSDKNIRIDIVL